MAIKRYASGIILRGQIRTVCPKQRDLTNHRCLGNFEPTVETKRCGYVFQLVLLEFPFIFIGNSYVLRKMVKESSTKLKWHGNHRHVTTDLEEDGTVRANGFPFRLYPIKR